MNITRREIPSALLATLLVAGLPGGQVALAENTNDNSFEPRGDLPPALLINIRTFFGPIVGNYFINNIDFDRTYPTYDQFRKAFAAPGENVDLGAGLRLISGFKPRDAGIQAAVVATPSNDVLAAALIHQNCRREGFNSKYPGAGFTPCALNTMATIFVGLEIDAALAATDALRVWAHNAIERHRSMFPHDLDNSKTDVIDVVRLR